MKPETALPSLVRGRSALGWQRTIFWLLVIGLSAALLGFAGSAFERSFPRLHAVLPFIFVPAVVLGFGSRMLTLGGVPNEKAELRAGYTTLFGMYPNVPQLDPRTGGLVRGAGEPLVSRKSYRQHPAPPAFAQAATRPGQLSSISPAVVASTPTPRPNVILGSWPLLAVMVGGMAIFVLTFVVIEPDRIPADTVLLIAGATLTVGVIAMSLGAYPRKRKLRALRSLVPGAVTFTLTGAQEFVDTLHSLKLPNAPGARQGPAGSWAGSADGEGLSLWSGTPPTRFASIPWARVSAVSRGTMRTGSSLYGTVQVSIRSPDVTLSLPLVQPNGGSLLDVSPAETKWVAAELSRLRGLS